jgi:hypothetical protein
MPGHISSLRVAINATAGSSQWTGIGQYVRSLLDYLLVADSPHLWYLLSSSPQLSPDPSTRVLIVENRSPLWEQLQLPSLLSDYSIDVYHNPGFGLPLVKTCPCVCTVHDCIPKLFPDLVSPALRGLFSQWAEHWVRLADHLICVSEHTKHDFVHLRRGPRALHCSLPDRLRLLPPARGRGAHRSHESRVRD